MRRQTRRKLYAVFRFTMLGLWFLIVAFPMYWIIATSFKPAHEWFAWPPVYWSRTPTLENYRIVWTGQASSSTTRETASLQKPWLALGNSLVISLTATTLSVAFGTQDGTALAGSDYEFIRVGGVQGRAFAGQPLTGRLPPAAQVLAVEKDRLLVGGEAGARGETDESRSGQHVGEGDLQLEREEFRN